MRAITLLDWYSTPLSGWTRALTTLCSHCLHLLLDYLLARLVQKDLLLAFLIFVGRLPELISEHLLLLPVDTFFLCSSLYQETLFL